MGQDLCVAWRFLLRQRIATVATILGFVVPTLAAQNPAPPQPTFKSGVELVTVDATVVDKNGVPVRGLKPEDFVVTLQGQQRPVRLLDYLEFGAAATQETTGRGATPQPGVVHSRGGRVIVILFDDLSYRPASGKTLLAATERMLASFDVDDFIGITTTSGLGPTVNPTRDRAAVIASLHDKKMVGRYDDSAGQFGVTQQEALEIERDFPPDTFPRVVQRECHSADLTTQCADQLRTMARMLGDLTLRRLSDQLETYRHLITTLSSTSNPPIIIALTNGVPLGLDTSPYADSLDKIGNAAADAHVRFYALSELPDMVDFSRPLDARVLLQEGRFLNSGAQIVANAAGGEAFLVAGTADRFFKRIESETSGLYRLGVEAPTDIDKRRYLTVSVHLRQPGVTVRADRKAVRTTVAAAPLSVDTALRTRLAEGGMSYGVPLTVGTEMRRDSADPKHVEIDVSVGAAATLHGPLTIMFGLVNTQGAMIEAGEKIVKAPADGDYRLAFPVRVESGRYRLRVVAADASANVGSVEKEISAVLAHIGTYTVSDLITAVTGADGGSRLIALDSIPRATHTLTILLELYPDDASAAAAVQVRFDLLQAGTAKPIATSAIAPALSGSARTASWPLPVGDLAPGLYTIRATVIENGAETGAVSSTFRTTGQ